MKLILIFLLLLTSCTVYTPEDRYEEQRRLYEEIYKAQQERMQAEAELDALKAELHREVMKMYEAMILKSEYAIMVIKRRLK